MNVGIGDPGNKNRFIFESKGRANDGNWHKIAVQIDKFGGENGFLKARLDGVPLKCVRMGKLLVEGSRLYPFPMAGVGIGYRGDLRFHGAIKEVKISVHDDPQW